MGKNHKWYAVRPTDLVRIQFKKYRKFLSMLKITKLQSSKVQYSKDYSHSQNTKIIPMLGLLQDYSDYSHSQITLRLLFIITEPILNWIL